MQQLCIKCGKARGNSVVFGWWNESCIFFFQAWCCVCNSWKSSHVTLAETVFCTAYHAIIFMCPFLDLPSTPLCCSVLLFFFYSIHPFMPLLATSSGQRQFPWPGDSEGDSASDTEGSGAVISQQDTRQDNVLTLWWAGPLSPAAEGSQDQSTIAAEAWISVTALSWYKSSYTCHVMFVVRKADFGLYK